MTSTQARTEPSQSLLRPMHKVLRASLLWIVIGIPIAAGLGYLAAGSAGMWGALLGLAMPVIFFSITAVVAVVTARMSPQLLGAAVLGSWLLKLVVLIAFLAVIADQDFYSRGALFAALLVGTIAYLVVEAVIVTRTKVLYVEPVDSV